MIKRILAASVVAVLGLPAGSSAAELTVTIPGRYFSPARTTAVTGDTVRWRNADRTAHTVRGHGVESGVLSPGAQFTHRFAQTGAHPYVCTLHPFMTGHVEVAGALLEAPAGEVLAGSAVELTGRAPAGSGPVVIERVSAGAGAQVATATPAADGRFSATVMPAETSSYRALAASGASAPVEVRVVATTSARLTVRRGRRFDRLRVSTRPALRGDFIAVLELYSRERFSWRRAATAKVDANGAARFRLRTGVRKRARVIVRTAATRAEVAMTRSVRVWRAGREIEPRRPSPDGGEAPHHH